MTNARIEKVQLSIERTQDKIAELTAKLRELEKQKTDLENRQIISLIRGERISDAQLNELMAAMRGIGNNPNSAGEIKTRFVSRQEDLDNAYYNEN